jgi:hypothetical protein
MAQIPRMSDLFSILGDERTLRIFVRSADGFESGTSGILVNGLSRKQFYSRLERLVDAGLISKDSGTYKQTGLGRLLYDTQIKPMENALAGFWTLQAVDELKKSRAIPEQEQKKIIQTLLGNTELKGVLAPSEKWPARVIGSYPELVEALLKLLDIAKTEVHIASRFYEPSVGSALVAKFAGGVSLNILDGNPSGTVLVERIRQAASVDTKNRDPLLKFLDSPRVKIASGGLGFSFAIVDRRYCGIELVNPLNPSEFFAAAEFEDGQFAARMIEIFNDVMSKAPENKEIKQRTMIKEL